MISVMLNVQANEGVEEAEERRLPPGVVPIVVHVALQEDGHAPDETSLEKIGPGGERLEAEIYKLKVIKLLKDDEAIILRAVLC